MKNIEINVLLSFVVLSENVYICLVSLRQLKKVIKMHL